MNPTNQSPIRPFTPTPPKPENIKSVKEGTRFRCTYFGEDGSIVTKPKFFKDHIECEDDRRIRRIEGTVQLHPLPKTFEANYHPITITVDQGDKKIVYKYLDLDLLKQVEDQIPDNASLPEFQSTDEVQDYFFNPSRFG